MTNLLPKTRFNVGALVSVLAVLTYDHFPSSLKSACDNLIPAAFVFLLVLILAASVWLPIETRSLKQRAKTLQLGKRSIEDRLDDLERLKRRAMVTPEEYNAKRKDILNDL